MFIDIYQKIWQCRSELYNRTFFSNKWNNRSLFFSLDYTDAYTNIPLSNVNKYDNITTGYTLRAHGPDYIARRSRRQRLRRRLRKKSSGLKKNKSN